MFTDLSESLLFGFVGDTDDAGCLQEGVGRRLAGGGKDQIELFVGERCVFEFADAAVIQLML